MKKWILACLLLAGLSATAQHMTREGRGRQQMQEFSPDEMATLQSKKMMLALDLSSNQQQELKTLLSKRIQKRQEMRQAHQKDTAALADPRQRYQRMNERLDGEIAFRQDLKKILTEPQYDKWRQMNPPREMGHPPGRKHRKG